MKKEILRIHNLNYALTTSKKLQDISLFVLEGDRTGFFGLSESGKDYFTQLILGDLEIDSVKHHIYIRGQQVKNKQELKKIAYRMSSFDFKITWNVAEYIGLKDSSWLMSGLNERLLREKIQKYIDEFDVAIPLNKKIEDLTEVEKRIVDVIRAYHLGAKILIIEEEFKNATIHEVREFSAKLLKLQKKTKLAVIVNSHSEQVMNLLSDNCVVFQDGRIVKKGMITQLGDQRLLEHYLLGQTKSSMKKSLEAYSKELEEKTIFSDEVVCSVDQLTLHNGKTVRFDFNKGKITTLLVVNNKDIEYLYNQIVGQGTTDKIAGVRRLGSKNEIFRDMCVGDNILLPSLEKITHWDYLLNSAGLLKSVGDPGSKFFPTVETKMDTLEVNEVIAVTLERWLIFHPKVLVLLAPFASCDVYGVSLVKTYLRRFTQINTSVVIIQAREEYADDISDEIIAVYGS